MIAIDTNVLVYAHRADSPHHEAALAAVHEVGASADPVGLPWPCVHEFLAITTHPRIYDPPSSTGQAWAAIGALTALPHLHLLSETREHESRMRELTESASVVGPKVHDARIAAICLDHGVRELWTADRDFSFFPALRTRNPLVRPRSEDTP